MNTQNRKRIHSDAFNDNQRNYQNGYVIGKRFMIAFNDVIEYRIFKPNEIMKKMPNIKNYEKFNNDESDKLIFEKVLFQGNI